MLPNNIEHTLRDWIAFYSKSRRVGHTVAAVNGVKKAEAHLVIHNPSFARNVGTKSLVYSETEKLIGFHGPVVWDNCALIDLFLHTMHRIEYLKEECKKAERERDIALTPKGIFSRAKKHVLRAIARVKSHF
jgi:hypothetical protein